MREYKQYRPTEETYKKVLPLLTTKQAIVVRGKVDGKTFAEIGLETGASKQAAYEVWKQALKKFPKWAQNKERGGSQ